MRVAGGESFSTERRNASQEPLAAVIGFYTWGPRAAQNSVDRRRKKKNPKKTEVRRKGKRAAEVKAEECRLQLSGAVTVE